MTTKIDQSDPNLIRSATAGQSQAKERGMNATDSGTTSRPAPSETLQLTTGARDAAEVARNLASAPAFDSDRVEGIRQAIANGDYPIDAERLADAILSLENELPGSNNDG